MSNSISAGAIADNLTVRSPAPYDLQIRKLNSNMEQPACFLYEERLVMALSMLYRKWAKCGNECLHCNNSNQYNYILLIKPVKKTPDIRVKLVEKNHYHSIIDLLVN